MEPKKSGSTKIQDNILLKERVTIQPPSLYNVIMLNDDYTTMDFVIWILQDVFHKTASESQKLMLEVHTQGKSIVGKFTFDVAQTKIAQVQEYAKKEGYPLKCVMEKGDR